MNRYISCIQIAVVSLIILLMALCSRVCAGTEHGSFLSLQKGNCWDYSHYTRGA